MLYCVPASVSEHDACYKLNMNNDQTGPAFAFQHSVGQVSFRMENIALTGTPWVQRRVRTGVNRATNIRCVTAGYSKWFCTIAIGDVDCMADEFASLFPCPRPRFPPEDTSFVLSRDLIDRGRSHTVSRVMAVALLEAGQPHGSTEYVGSVYLNKRMNSPRRVQSTAGPPPVKIFRAASVIWTR